MKRFATLRDEILHQKILLFNQGAGLHAENESVLLLLQERKMF